MIRSQIIGNTLVVDIDNTLYSDMVISKVCYWLTEDYTVCREYIADSIHRLTIEPKNGIVDNSHFDNLRHKISQLLADYKLREIILMETKDIRNILYIKAFANNDEFEDYNLEL